MLRRVLLNPKKGATRTHTNEEFVQKLFAKQEENIAL